MSITRRIEKLEKQTSSGEPVTININTTVVGMDGEVQSKTTKVIHLGSGGVQSCPSQ